MKHTEEHELFCRRLTTIVDSIADGVVAVDLDWNICFLNKAAERITGFKAEEAMGKPCNTVFRTNVCDEQCPLRYSVATGKPVVNRPVCITSKRGRRIPISVSTALLKDPHGQIIGGVEVFRDLDLAGQMQKQFEAKYTYENLIGQSRGMRKLFNVLPTIAESDSTVLIEGESGTGKELVARALHNLSPRKGGPFVSINCGALPDNLLESELFGYMAGAFTDAKKDKKGRFALAETGTLLLDEIGDVSPAMQAKLLRVLQERTFEPLGGTQTMTADVRFVAATNRPVDKLVADGQFRQDLFYRINVIRLVIPPLRDRKEDIPLLIDHFIDEFNRLRHKDISGISVQALERLMKHSFPGNIRELENIIEHAFVLSPGGIIKPEHLPDYLRDRTAVPAVAIARTMDDMESLFIIAALKRNDWSRKDTARELGINASTLYRKITKLGLKVPTTND